MKFRLATFNLENLGGGEDVALRARLAGLRPQLERLEADILCLQEINAENGETGPRRLETLDRLLAGTPYAGFARAVTLNDAGTDLRDVHNLVVLSRFPIRASRQLLNELVPPPSWRPLTARPPARAAHPVGWDRPILYARIDLAGRPLHVVNLHLRAPIPAHIAGQKTGPWSWASIAGYAEGCFLAEMKRAGQAFEARLFIESLFDAEPAALVAVAGDFNAGPAELPTAIIRGGTDDTGNPALAGRALRPLEAAVPPPQRFSVLHGGATLMLDHLMVSPALHAAFRGAAIHNERLADELFGYLFGRKPATSYHAPVVASFAF